LAATKPARAVHRIEDGLQFSEAAKRYLAEVQRDPAAKLTEHTRGQNEFVYRLFEAFADNAPLATIDKRRAADFLDHVAEERGLSNRTLNRYTSALSAVWTWADRRGHFEGRNPFKGQWRDQGKGTGYRQFDVEELNKLFAAPLLRETERIRPARYTFQTAMAWVPLVALFSGMRSGEICQLNKGDVIRKNGVWAFRVSAEGEGQYLKTEAAARLVPIHSELIACGFLEYWKALPSGQLWPALRPGGPDGKMNDYFTKRFVAYRRSCGVTGERKSFHSFRKNAAQALKNARVTPAEIAELIGHEQGYPIHLCANGAARPCPARVD
jgi:integrase